MKFKIQLKDPDGYSESISDAVSDSIDESLAGLSTEEREAVAEARLKKFNEVCANWFEYSEYLTVEIDTEANTCTVVPR